MLSFNLFFLLCIAGLATSAPITHHRQRLLDTHFPYGKLADKLLNVNDRNYDVSDMIDDFDEDMLVHVYPENHSLPSFSSALPISRFELPPPTRNVCTKNQFSFLYHIPDIIKEVITRECIWETALVRWL